MELELQYQKKTTDNIVMCYDEKISPYRFGLWAKAALLTGRQNVSQGQYFIHLASSLHHCERVFFWAVYNNTCALYFPQINGNARGAAQDGCHRQVNLSTAEQRPTGQDKGDQPIRWDEPRRVALLIGPLIAPICGSLLWLKKLFFLQFKCLAFTFLYLSTVY